MKTFTQQLQDKRDALMRAENDVEYRLWHVDRKIKHANAIYTFEKFVRYQMEVTELDALGRTVNTYTITKQGGLKKQ